MLQLQLHAALPLDHEQSLAAPCLTAIRALFYSQQAAAAAAGEEQATPEQQLGLFRWMLLCTQTLMVMLGEGTVAATVRNDVLLTGALLLNTAVGALSSSASVVSVTNACHAQIAVRSSCLHASHIRMRTSAGTWQPANVYTSFTCMGCAGCSRQAWAGAGATAAGSPAGNHHEENG